MLLITIDPTIFMIFVVIILFFCKITQSSHPLSRRRHVLRHVREFSSSTYPSNEVYLLWDEAIDRFEVSKIENSPNPHGQGSFYYLTIIYMNGFQTTLNDPILTNESVCNI